MSPTRSWDEFSTKKQLKNYNRKNNNKYIGHLRTAFNTFSHTPAFRSALFVLILPQCKYRCCTNFSFVFVCVSRFFVVFFWFVFVSSFVIFHSLLHVLSTVIMILQTHKTVFATIKFVVIEGVRFFFLLFFVFLFTFEHTSFILFIHLHSLSLFGLYTYIYIVYKDLHVCDVTNRRDTDGICCCY